MNRVKVGFYKCRDKAIIPKYAHNGDSGMDIFACVDYTEEEKQDLKIGYKEDTITLYPYETKIIPTGLKAEIPYGYELQVRATSGNSLKTGLRVANGIGTIDSNYRGEIGVIFTNNGKGKIEIKHGSKIAQLVLQEVPYAEIIELDTLSEETNRGVNGYGSTGGI